MCHSYYVTYDNEEKRNELCNLETKFSYQSFYDFDTTGNTDYKYINTTDTSLTSVTIDRFINDTNWYTDFKFLNPGQKYYYNVTSKGRSNIMVFDTLKDKAIKNSDGTCNCTP